MSSIGPSRASFAEVSAAISQIGPDAWREEHEQEAQRLVEAGVPESVAHRHAFQPELVHAPDIIAVAHATGRAPLEIARGFFVLGERLDIDWLEQQLEKLPAATRWQRWAQQSMEDDLFALRRTLCERVLELAGGAGIDEAIERFFEDRAQTCERVMRFLRGLKMEGVSDLSQLTVAVRQLRSIAG
jgi:glutamate dehydrogenase